MRSPGTTVANGETARPTPMATQTAPVLLALLQRLTAVAGALRVAVDITDRGDEDACSLLFSALVDRVVEDEDRAPLWLLLTALSGALPDSNRLVAASRARELSDRDHFSRWLLETCHPTARQHGSAYAELDVVEGGVVVDVDFSSRNELHTGIQRVVRETVPRWAREHDLVLVAWTDAGGAMRRLSEVEQRRVLMWGRAQPTPARTEADDEAPVPRLIVPWRSLVLFPENPAADHCPQVAALARFSGNEVAMIGYDFIPAISPELIHPGLPQQFMQYLEAVKFAHRVVGISAAATREFAGFVDMLAAQGLPGPTVSACPLPVEVPAGTTPPADDLVICIGSFEPRKNQLAVLHAAERLWREGHRFRLQFIGGGGWVTEFDALLRRLQGAGRPARRDTAISDDRLWELLRSARFSVFLSRHEGFGLPVAESLACGTPCLTTEYGSTREIADEGGTLVVDPQDDQAIADQMRILLTDDALLQKLRSQALARPVRTWDDYARELWERIIVTTPDAQEVPA